MKSCAGILAIWLAAITIAWGWQISAAPQGEDADLPAYTTSGADTCLRCHDADTKVPVMAIFATPHGQRGDPRSPFATLQCETCHGPGSEHGRRLRRGEERAPLIDFKTTHHDTDKLNGICLSCHDDQRRALWHDGDHARAGVVCTSCHVIHAARDPALDRHTQTGLCTACHRREGAELQRFSHHPLKDGQMVCTDCHAPHSAANGNRAMLVRASVNDVCYDCHAEKRGPFLWEHAPATEDCTLCHRPHGSNHRALLTRAMPLLCQTCHSQAGHPSVAYTPDGLPAGRASAFLLLRSCTNCHSQVHGSNHPSGASLNR